MKRQRQRSILVYCHANKPGLSASEKTMKSFAELRSDSNQTGIQFLLTEIELARSFLDIANRMSDPTRSQRLITDSRKAFETVIHLMPRFELTPRQQSAIDSKLQEIYYGLKLHGVSIRAL